MEKALFEQLGGTYTRVGNYLLPNLTLSEEKQSIGIWGQRHARYLKQHHIGLPVFSGHPCAMRGHQKGCKKFFKGRTKP